MSKVELTFLWHMHQPCYRWPGSHDALLPWVRLHAAKAYYDLAWMLKRHPDVRVAVNFSGILVRQLREYVEGTHRDDWWHLTLTPAEALDMPARRFMLEHFFSIHHDRCIRPMPRYRDLLERRGPDVRAIDPSAFSAADLRDLQVLFNLQWCGYGLRAESPVVQRLVARQRGYDEDDKRALLDVHIEAMRALGPMWRELVERGQVELTTTPMYHPILPLLVDSDSAREGLPGHPLPGRFVAPDDADAHVRTAIEEVEAFFGVAVRGMWPAEGSVSQQAAGRFAAAGLDWIASDEWVLERSPRDDFGAGPHAFTPWRVETTDGPIAMYFREHGLSDLIGFTYARNDPRQAAHDFVRRVAAAGRGWSGPRVPRVAVILDGENPWESYEDDGRPFLDALFEALSRSADVTTALPGDVELHDLPTIHRLHAGSWIDANFRIWIGQAVKNRAWEHLRAAREAWARARDAGDVDAEALRQGHEALMAAEGSDWFWWYGDDHESANDAQFDELFRRFCALVYEALGQAPPADLDIPLARAQSRSDASPPRTAIHVEVDGVETDYWEWKGAGEIMAPRPRGSMHQITSWWSRIAYGYDADHLALRLDVTDAARPIPDAPLEVELGVTVGDERVTMVWAFTAGRRHGVAREADGEGCAALADFVEVRVPMETIGLVPGQAFGLDVQLRRGGVDMVRLPTEGAVALRAPDAASWAGTWLV